MGGKQEFDMRYEFNPNLYRKCPYSEASVLMQGQTNPSELIFKQKKQGRIAK
jgi:hypothetical protein